MIKVRFGYQGYDDSLWILIGDVDNTGHLVAVAQPMKLEFKEVKKEDKIEEPTLRLSCSIKDEFLKAMAEALDKEGIKTENDFKIQGLLEATKYHLEDMRKIVFK